MRLPAFRARALIAMLMLAACAPQSPPATPVATHVTTSAGVPADVVAAPSRDQAWRICQDPARGLGAVEACTALLSTGEESSQRQAYLHYNRGLALSRRGRTQEAIADFDATLQRDPSFALAYYQRGLIYQSQGQQVRAEFDLLRARQLNPRLP